MNNKLAELQWIGRTAKLSFADPNAHYYLVEASLYYRGEFYRARHALTRIPSCDEFEEVCADITREFRRLVGEEH